MRFGVSACVQSVSACTHACDLHVINVLLGVDTYVCISLQVLIKRSQASVVKPLVFPARYILQLFTFSVEPNTDIPA